MVIQKLADAAADVGNHGYSKSNGIANLRREVCSKYYRNYGVNLDPDHEVIACLGSKEGFSHMCLALMGPGDTAMIPAPYFPVHMYGVILASGNVVSLDVADPDRFLSNVAYTCEHLAPHPKVLIVNYPHNPSSAVVEPEFFVEVVRLAKKYGFLVIHDFAYADVAFDGYQPPSFFGGTGRQGRGRRIHDDEQGLQHGRLACWLLRRQRRHDPWAGHDQGLLRLRNVFRRSRLPRSWRCEKPRQPSRSNRRSTSVAVMCWWKDCDDLAGALIHPRPACSFGRRSPNHGEAR